MVFRLITAFFTMHSLLFTIQKNNYNGSFFLLKQTADDNANQFFQNIFGGQDQYVSVVLSVPFRSYFLLQASFDGLWPKPRLSALYGPEKSSQEMDIQGFRLGKTQYVNLKVNQTFVNKVYISIFNYDIQQRQQPIFLKVKITTGINQKICHSCFWPSVSQVSTCSCLSCPADYIGYDCSTYQKILTSSLQQERVLFNNKLYNFRIQKQQEQFQVKIFFNGKAQLYIQQIKSDKQFASHANVMYLKGTQARYNLNQDYNQLLITISSVFEISLTFAKYEESSTRILLSYSVSQDYTLIAILVTVAICFLLLVIIGGTICYIRKRRVNNQDIVISNIGQQTRAYRCNNVLSSQQIDRYFPEYTQQMLDNVVLMPFQLNSMCHDTKDCIICLCIIQVNQRKRVTYCRHEFHSECLIQWFQKNRNCPYCRKQFNRKDTIKNHQELLRKSGQEKLEATRLVKQILQQTFKATDSTKRPFNQNKQQSGHILNQQQNNGDSLILELQNF